MRAYLHSLRPVVFLGAPLFLFVSPAFGAHSARAVPEAAAAIGFTADCESVEFYEHVMLRGDVNLRGEESDPLFHRDVLSNPRPTLRGADLYIAAASLHGRFHC